MLIQNHFFRRDTLNESRSSHCSKSKGTRAPEQGDEDEIGDEASYGLARHCPTSRRLRDLLHHVLDERVLGCEE